MTFALQSPTSAPATLLTREEQQALRRLVPLLEETQSYPLAVQPPLTRPTVQVINGSVWEFLPLEASDPTPRPLPSMVYRRLTYLEAIGVPLCHFIWVEEHASIAHRQRTEAQRLLQLQRYVSTAARLAERAAIRSKVRLGSVSLNTNKG